MTSGVTAPPAPLCYLHTQLPLCSPNNPIWPTVNIKCHQESHTLHSPSKDNYTGYLNCFLRRNDKVVLCMVYTNICICSKHMTIHDAAAELSVCYVRICSDISYVTGTVQISSVSIPAAIPILSLACSAPMSQPPAGSFHKTT